MGTDVLVWFKRDLRVQDNPVLAEAAARGSRILPLFIVEPEAWAQPDASARQWRFVSESLAILRGDLAQIGAPLVVRTGAAIPILQEVLVATGIREVLSLEETGNGWSYARDRAVAAVLRAAGVTWREIPQMGVVRRLDGRDGWAARRDRVIRAGQVATPKALRGFPIEPGPMPEARDLGLGFDPCPGRQKGGRPEALTLLSSFLDSRGRQYRRAMSSPLEGATACSRLSPHLAWGTISPREAAEAAALRKREAKGTREGWAGAMQSFEARLAWRDHFMQKLEDEPALEHRCLHSAYEGLRGDDATRRAAWEAGETGFPFVDACMRSLIATGWLNFRMRAMLVSFASYHLWLDWRSTGPHLARMFTDYEPGIHWPQMQMQSGTTGMNTVRMYNPVKQGLEQDPTGAFTRHWCPELRDVPDAFLQEPWRWDGAGRVLGKRYPVPLIDLAQAGRTAREKVWAVRHGDAFRSEAAQIVEKHASRKDGGAGRHFVNDRAPRRGRRTAAVGQLSLDL
ncbi:FAD-binding domain-containing protein [Roseicyclus marinus]|uniref:FAD-binding domain-containing protein n=1 Tax=Roseicyclus marinus TaxID=2161673 RepID=UPI0024105419|nr:FAD-binding domain-containing protein [Roseicyclus marinus]MDG3042399.1 FAD-binding domain-containing protein [Roseicyclus marinus]